MMAATTPPPAPDAATSAWLAWGVVWLPAALTADPAVDLAVAWRRHQDQGDTYTGYSIEELNLTLWPRGRDTACRVVIRETFSPPGAFRRRPDDEMELACIEVEIWDGREPFGRPDAELLIRSRDVYAGQSAWCDERAWFLAAGAVACFAAALTTTEAKRHD